jgi:hypothetical protein
MIVNDYNNWFREKRIKEIIIKHLHEGRVRIERIEDALNESNLHDFAKKELELLVNSVENKGESPLIKEFIPEILSLVDKFGNSGQSGGSAPYTAGAIISALKKLLMFDPISPVTGEPDEWDNGEIGEGVFQNRRCSSVFKEGKRGKPYYLDAIVWKTQKGSTWTGTAKTREGDNIRSRQFIKSFPFTPKTFVIEVDEEEVNPDDWEFYIKDPKQLEDVWKYYKKPD